MWQWARRHFDTMAWIVCIMIVAGLFFWMGSFTRGAQHVAETFYRIDAAEELAETRRFERDNWKERALSAEAKLTEIARKDFSRWEKGLKDLEARTGACQDLAAGAVIAAKDMRAHIKKLQDELASKKE